MVYIEVIIRLCIQTFKQVLNIKIMAYLLSP